MAVDYTVTPPVRPTGNIGTFLAPVVQRNPQTTVGSKCREKAGIATAFRRGPNDWILLMEGLNSIDYGALTNYMYTGTTTDTVNWVLDTTTIMSPLDNTSWENGEICPTSLVWNPVSRLFHLYYHGGNNSGNRQVGLMTSPTAAAGSWTRYASNPIVPIGPGAYDIQAVADCRVVRRSATDWRMYYRAGVTGGAYTTIAYATSTDGKAWTKQGVVMGLGTGNDSNNLLGNWGYEDELGRYHMIYYGVDSVGTGRMLYAYSDDWTTFTRNSADVLASKSTTSTDPDYGGIADGMSGFVDDQFWGAYGLCYNGSTYNNASDPFPVGTRLEGRMLWWWLKKAAVQPTRSGRGVQPVARTGTGFVTVPNGASLLNQNTAFTIWMDFRLMPGNTYRVLYFENNAFNNQLKIGIAGDGTFDCWMRKPTGTPDGIAQLTSVGTSYADNKWHRLLMVRTAPNAFALYVDGVSVATSTKSLGTADVTPTFFTLLAPNTADTDWTATSPYGIGGVSRQVVTIAGYAMTPTEELALWNSGNGSGAVPSSGTLKLNLLLGSGGQAGPDVDTSGNAYSCTVTNMAPMVNGGTTAAVDLSQSSGRRKASRRGGGMLAL